MVRLQPISVKVRTLNEDLVSIPLWFDYNVIIVEVIIVYEVSLNSTMVRLQLIELSDMESDQAIGLNSTMVRLQLTLLAAVTVSYSLVSIPLWFDYNIKS